jgi:hypothetical protein
MDIVVTNLNKVYLLGGSVDARFDFLSDSVMEWNLLTGYINLRKNMLWKTMDFGSCYLNGYIYVVGGWIDRLFDTSAQSA